MLKGLVALGGIYLLFIIEHCIRMFKHYKQQRVSAAHGVVHVGTALSEKHLFPNTLFLNRDVGVQFISSPLFFLTLIFVTLCHYIYCGI